MADEWLIECEACGAHYRGNSEMAGKTLRCKCGSTISVSATEDSPDSDSKLAVDDFEADTSDPEHRPTPPPPATRVSPVMEALLTREDDTGIAVFRERILPYVFLSIGLAAQMILWFVWIKGTGNGLAVMGIAVLIQMVLFTPLMLFMMVTLAKWIDLDIGTFFSLLFKVAALTFGPLGLADAFLTISLVVSEFNWHVIAAGFGFYVVLAGLPTWILFRTNVGETALILTISYFPRMVVVYIAATFLDKWGIIG